MSNYNFYPEIDSPAYVLEEEKFIRNLEVLQRVQDESGVDIIMALKALAMWQIFPKVNEYLSGATASSLNEAMLIYEEMEVRPHLFAPAVRPAEIPEVARICQSIVFNSLSEYERHYETFRSANPDILFGLRVNPGYSEIETDLYDPAGPGSRLGQMELDEIPDGLTGLHFHALCENNSFTFERVLTAFEKKFADILPRMQWVNFGGGHLITQEDYDVEHLLSVLLSFRERHPHLHMIMEPGAAIGWQAGFLKATVLDVIHTPVRRFLMLDVSFTAHMPDCLEMPYDPAVRNAQKGSEGEYVYHLGGSSCLAGDQIGPYSFEREMEPGDVLIFEDMIHYTMVKTTMFNGVHHPDIGILYRDGNYERYRRFTYEDYKTRMG